MLLKFKHQALQSRTDSIVALRFKLQTNMVCHPEAFLLYLFIVDYLVSDYLVSEFSIRASVVWRMGIDIAEVS